MAKISKVTLELVPLLGGKYRAKVKYNISFTNLEVQAGARYRHLVRLIGDDTNTPDVFDDGHDEPQQSLVYEEISAQSSPISVTLDEGPFPLSALTDEDLDNDEIRAKVVVAPTPAFSELNTVSRESPMLILN